MASVAIPTLPTPASSGTHRHRNRQQASFGNNGSSSLPPSSSSEAVYTTLIQTYLNLLCYDNATFLAERCAASFPRSENAVYLLAYCHYRGGHTKAARSVLLTRWLGRNANPARGGSKSKIGRRGVGRSSNDASVGDAVVVDVELERTRSSARYLLSKACYDLGLYSKAEESLLKHCRETFALAVAEGGGIINGAKVRGNRNEAMDAWIVQSSQQSSASPRTTCPIPNGSAGLYLLGNICRKTNRRQRAIECYRLSLKLDPLMWTSYEAICELGGTTSSSDEQKENGAQEADDPNVIFGVDAPLLSPRGGGRGLGGGHGHGFEFATRAGGRSNVNASTNNESVMASGGQHHSLHSFKLNRYGTPSTPYSGFDNMKIGTYTNEQSTKQGGMGVNFHLPATASTIAARPRARTRGDSDAGSLPQTNLFAATPAIDETAATPGQRTVAATPNDEGVSDDTPPSSAIGYANQVLDRARRVVAGLTYEPSPESVRHHRPPPGTVKKMQQHARPADLTFSSTPMLPTSAGTPGASFLAGGLSTVKGEKRALFMTNETKSRRKTPKTEGGAKQTVEASMMDAATPGVEHVEQPAFDKDDAGDNNQEQLQLQLDVDEGMADESKHVGKVLELLCGLGAAYKYLCQFRSQDALELFRALPPEQINTGWVQHQIGKAHFEMSDYQNAQRALTTMQKIEPHRIKGLDILSTTLWQLKKEVELSDLAQRAVDFDKTAPESWFVVGNCFSLQKEHETAVVFFRRAIQLDPSYTYAHTLCGHEYTSNEDFEKAISCYRDAIRVDSRHYNAWYGLGAIYFRQEKFDLAEYHFKRALDINCQSSVLHCHLGMAQHQNGKTMEALDTLAGAFRLDPRNPQAHYQRATIFMTLDRPQDALAELEKVRSAAPKEASVHFNMGKVHKRLGNPSQAMRCFLTALDLDPKDNNLIKAAMDRLDEPDVEEEVSVF